MRVESERGSFTAGRTVAAPEPPPSAHIHTMLYMAERPATETESGIREHWYCIDCQKNFLDEAGGPEAAPAQLTIPQLPRPSTPQAVFLDVPAGEYYSAAVAWAVSSGVATGTDREHFSPDAPCTRAQAVTFLWRAMGSPGAGGSVPFEDVETGAFYYDALRWALFRGIVTGTDAGHFSPDAPCTRAQAVTFLHRAQGLPYGGESRFSDVDETAWYAQAVAWSAFRGITNGTGADTFSPDETCTRGQIITFLYRAFA